MRSGRPTVHKEYDEWTAILLDGARFSSEWQPETQRARTA